MTNEEIEKVEETEVEEIENIEEVETDVDGTEEADIESEEE